MFFAAAVSAIDVQPAAIPTCCDDVIVEIGFECLDWIHDFNWFLCWFSKS